MSLFQKKPLWKKATKRLTKIQPEGVAKAGLSAVGTMVGMTVISAVVSAVRERQGR